MCLTLDQNSDAILLSSLQIRRGSGRRDTPRTVFYSGVFTFPYVITQDNSRFRTSIPNPRDVRRICGKEEYASYTTVWDLSPAVRGPLDRRGAANPVRKRRTRRRVGSVTDDRARLATYRRRRADSLARRVAAMATTARQRGRRHARDRVSRRTCGATVAVTVFTDRRERKRRR